MARDGSGTHSLPQAAFVSGTTIESAKVNSNFSDISSSLTASLAKDGQTVPTANLPMGGFKHTGAADGSARTDYASLGQVAKGTLFYAADTGSADAYAVAPSPGIAANVVGFSVTWKVTNANLTTTPTLAANSLTAGTIVWPDGTALAAGDLPAGALVVTKIASLSGSTPTWHLMTRSVSTTRLTLKIDSRTTVADTAYTVTSADYLVAYTSLSTNRTVTLPAASTFNAGRRLVIMDESGSASQTVAISLAPNGSDTIAGSNTTQVIINVPRGKCELECNGSSGWHVVGEWSVRYSSAMGADVSLSNTASYFDTVSVAQGTVGTWRAMCKATVTSGGVANVNGKLWDGTTVIDSGRETVAGTNQAHMITMLGDITAPAGNIKVSVNDASRTDGTVKYNFSGSSKDTSLLVWRVS